MIKIAFIGAGSIAFTRRLIQDIMTVKSLNDKVGFSFTDIDEEALEYVTDVCRRDIKENGLEAAITATPDRREALKDADYVINTVRIGGIECLAYDVEIPLKYGVDQHIGDTLCAGGIMYGQRGIGAILEFCRDIKEVSKPGCLLLNYTNPNAMVTWACIHYGKVNTVGLCHGVPGTQQLIAAVLGVDYNELYYRCGGINHQTWFVELKYRGEDMTGKLLDAFLNHEKFKETEKVRIDLLKRFGYFSTESSGHVSEYLAWYRKRPSDLPNWTAPYPFSGETAWYLKQMNVIRDWKSLYKSLMDAPVPEYTQDNRSVEHFSHIVEAIETDKIYRGYFNVVNGDTIPNLPEDAIIEVPGYVDQYGFGIPKFGALPSGCAAVCSASISVQRLSVQAAVSGDAMILKQAMMMDPLTGAVCNPPEISDMTDELLIAQEKWLPQYKDAIAAIKAKRA